MVAAFNTKLVEEKNTSISPAREINSVDEANLDLPEFPELLPIHVKHLICEGFTAKKIEQWIKQGLKSLTEEEAIKMGFKAWVNGEWKSGSGIYFPFTPSFGQLRLDEPIIRSNGKAAKYLTPNKKKTQAYLPSNCMVVTEGIKDAMAGSWSGGIPTGAMAGVSHYRKALEKNSGKTILFDADGWLNPQVFLNLFKAGLWVKGKVQLLPEIPGYPKAGLCEYFKAGHTASDYKKLIDSAYKPEDLLMEWPLHWEKMPEKWLSKAIRTAFKLAAKHLDEIQRERLLNRIKKAARISILKLRSLLQKEVNLLNKEIELKKLNPRQVAKYIFSKYDKKLRLNELGNIIELEGEEYDLDEAYIHLLMENNIYSSKFFVTDVLKQVAKTQSYNPVKDYLNNVACSAIPVDINNLSSRYFGTSNPLYDIFFKKTLIAAVARIYDPGCKVDTTLVLQGDQGLGKSTVFKVLGGEWFDDSMADARDKDDLLKLHQCWIQEWGEVERVFSKQQAGVLKAFLSRSTDLYREPYAPKAKRHKRHSIIVATVNNAQFLVDSTGNRRYWIIPVLGEAIDLELLKKERDGIWAAAVAAYKAGEPWWLTPEFAKLSEDNNSHFKVTDEWESAIANYTENLNRVSVTEILEKVFDFEIGKMDRGSQMRVATILTFLGWTKVGMRERAGKRQQCWEKSPTQEPPKNPIDELKNQVATSQVEIKEKNAESTEISSSSQPLNLNRQNELKLKNSQIGVDTSTIKPRPIPKKEILKKVGVEGIEVASSPLNQGFEVVKTSSQPETVPKKEILKKVGVKGIEVASSPLNQGFEVVKTSSQPETVPKKEILKKVVAPDSGTNLPNSVKPICDTFETGTIKVKIENINDGDFDSKPKTIEQVKPAFIDEATEIAIQHDNVVVPQALPKANKLDPKKEIVLKTSDGIEWSTDDVTEIAKSLSEQKDLEAFSAFLYPNNETWLPPKILNMAVKTLNIDEYEQIKAWVAAIKNKSREADKGSSIEPKFQQETFKVAEPDWSTFPHLTSNDPRTAKNLSEEIRNAILTLTVSEGTDALYSRFNCGQVEWVSQHCLNDREKALLEQLKNCKQLGLFGDEFEEQSEEYLSDYGI